MAEGPRSQARQRQMTALGDHLKTLRGDCGLTLRDVEFATQHVIKSGYLSQIEIGKVKKPGVQKLLLLADVYQASPDQLFDLAGIRVPSLPNRPAMNPKEVEMLRVYRSLTPSDRVMILDFARHRLRRNRKK